MSVSAWLDIAVGVIALVALALLFNGRRHWRHGRRWRGLRHGAGGCVCGLVAALVLALGLNLLTYSRLTAEVPAGTIAFSQQASQRYLAVFTRPDGSRHAYKLRGDQWRLGARFIKWKGIGNLLGLPPLYRLERLSGRYASLAEERRHYPSVYRLASPRGLSVWQATHGWAGWLPLVDARYGTATFLPMADGARYKVYVSTTGLLARPANPAARKAVDRWSTP